MKTQMMMVVAMLVLSVAPGAFAHEGTPVAKPAPATDARIAVARADRWSCVGAASESCYAAAGSRDHSALIACIQTRVEACEAQYAAVRSESTARIALRQ